MNPKIISLSRLKKLLARRKNKTIVFTNGCFDILHRGHVQYLAAAKRQGDLLIVGLNSDASVRRLKGPTRPIHSQRDRAEVLSALEAVDYIVIFGQDTPYQLIHALKPDVLVKGRDWPKHKIIGADIVGAQGGRVLTVPFIKGHSTSRLIQKILRLG